MRVDSSERKVTVIAYHNKVIITNGTKTIATHTRSYERDVYVLDYKHYLKELITKPNCIIHARPLRNANLPTELWTYYHQIKKKYTASEAGIFFIKVLMAYSIDEGILGIIQTLLKSQIFNIDYVLAKITTKDISKETENTMYKTNLSSLAKPWKENNYAQILTGEV